MNIYTFINKYYQHNPHGHYFDRDTLKVYGERISEMRVLKEIETVTDISGEVHQAYCLSSRQHKYPGGPRRKYTYFDVNTFDDIIL